MFCAVALRRVEGGRGRHSWQKIFGGFDLSIYTSCDPPSHSAPYHFRGNLCSDGTWELDFKHRQPARPHEILIKML